LSGLLDVFGWYGPYAAQDANRKVKAKGSGAMNRITFFLKRLPLANKSRLLPGKPGAFRGAVANFLSLQRFMFKSLQFQNAPYIFSALFSDGNARHRQTMKDNRWECPTIIAIATRTLSDVAATEAVGISTRS
jgi:hypothetical protein